MTDSIIRIIVFDIGGVMIRLVSGMEEACREAGIPYREHVLTPAERAELLRLNDELESGRIDIAEYTRQALAPRGDLYSPEELLATYRVIIREELPGIADIVSGLKRAGYRTACLSNTCDLHWPLLTDPARYPAIGMLDFQHASHLLSVRKPAPEIYRRFEALTGFTPPEILFFDDREENVKGALACDWHAVQILPERPVAEQIREALAAQGVEIA